MLRCLVVWLRRGVEDDADADADTDADAETEAEAEAEAAADAEAEVDDDDDDGPPRLLGKGRVSMDESLSASG